MSTTHAQLSAFPDSKSHYPILDGLRGIAAVMVVAFHLLEAYSMESHIDLMMNHGYLAVDFFYMLSGFVIGYAYDDRWGKMTWGGFAKRRLIRLHPMIIMGMIVGAVMFYFQGSTVWPGISAVPVWKLLLVMVIGFTLLPVPPSLDIRGWQEMHPLNGPGWSLFFEYIANILYALVIRKFSNKVLAVIVFIAGCALAHLAIAGPNGDVIGGWSIEPSQLRYGFTRLMYPFFAGLLLSRVAKVRQIKHAFLWSSALVVLVLSTPRIGGSAHLWMNGIYESVSIILIFPLIVYLGASGEVKGKIASRVCQLLGHISYPIYIIHYPFVCLYMAWVTDKKIPLKESWPVALLILLVCIALSYACLKLYDVPVRSYLTRRFVAKPTKKQLPTKILTLP